MSSDNGNFEYFENYQDLDVHHLMLADEPRTKAYKNAIFNMKEKFTDKIIMDVGAGTGILSIFCAQAGAKLVYAVEASNVSKLIPEVAKENKVDDVIKVLSKRVEEINANEIEKVDIIISEWMGFYLLHEGMLDSVIYARDNFLKTDGLMFPSTAKIYAAPCELTQYNAFWDNIHGVSMKSIGDYYKKSLTKPQVLTINKKDILAKETLLIWLDLNSVTIEDLNTLGDENVVTVCDKVGKYQGVVLWFDVEFLDDSCLSTSPMSDPTHWQQTVIVLPNTVDVKHKETLAFNIKLTRNNENNRRYNIRFEELDPLEIEHDIPCDCQMTKCIVTKAYMDNLDKETNVVEKI